MDMNIQQVEPGLILADDNARYGLKETRIDSLAEDITTQGGVMVPLEVEQLSEPVDGKLYRLTAGHYRLASLIKLNKDGAGLLAPVIIHQPKDALDRLKRQLSENVERESLSPIDVGEGIKKLLERGATKMEIRNIFKRAGGKKGNQVQPASNSFINMSLAFLDLPKPIREKIHNGLIGTAAAYQLTRVTPDKRQDVLDTAERDRIKLIEMEEKDEQKFLDGARKASEAETKAAQAQKELEAAQEAADAASKAADEAAEAAAAAYKEAKTAKESKAKKAAQEKLKEVEAASAEAVKAAAAAKRDLEKAENKTLSASAQAEARRKRLETARKASAKEKAKKPLTPEAIKKAAAKEGVPTSTVKLNAQGMRDAIHELCIPPNMPKVRQIGEAIQRCFDGSTTPQALRKELAVITGEKKEK